ncbi:MAG: heparinase II/III family protein [Planctomycetes bacterium]|nr:heparinase II/III family protein [Planctomycetota bacterium]
MIDTTKLKPILLTAIIACLFLSLSGCNQAEVEKQQKTKPKPEPKIEIIVDPNTVLDTLDKNHPRLMLKDDQLQALKAQHEKDEVLQRYIKDVIRVADYYLEKPPLTYKKKGPRLLETSRDCLRRISTLGLAYRWTGDPNYAEKATENLLAVCEFKDWNPAHFLDTAEMSHAVGLGYDWLYHYFDDDTREKIKAGLIKNGMKVGIQSYEAEGARWTKNKYNWNFVCNSGLVIGALAIADTDPIYAKVIVPKAVASIPTALQSYAPEGAWGEGLMYWYYATRYLAYGLTSMETALGTDFGLSQFPGLTETGLFPIYLAGPTGRNLNYGDTNSRSRRRLMPCMFYLAKKFNNSLISDDEHNVIAKNHGRRYHFARPHHVIWYLPPSKNTSHQKDLDKYFRGPVSIAVFRSSWDDPNALFVGIKGGFNNVGHGHLDLGNFELDALGIRWIKDLGRDNYNLSGYWDRKKGGTRWTYYRMNSFSHNIPMINNQNQDEYARVKFTDFKSEQSSAFAKIDLTSAYKMFATKVTRGLAVIQDRRAVLIQDEFELKKPYEISWGLTTTTDINITQDNIAELTHEGKKLVAKILSPKNAKFTIESAEQKPPQKTNKGTDRLMIRLPNSKGSVRIAVLLSPVWPDGKVVNETKIRPLKKWK